MVVRLAAIALFKMTFTLGSRKVATREAIKPPLSLNREIQPGRLSAGPFTQE